MRLTLWKACQILGIPPRIWMVPNSIKIYEFSQVVSPSGLKSKHRIMDFGCGKGHWTLIMARKCERAIGVDSSQSQISIAQKFLRNSPLKGHVKFICSELKNANLPDRSFDRIYTLSVLEHIPDLSDLLKEIVRLLKPGGEFHLSVDSLSTVKDENSLAKHKHDHSVVQYFTRDTLEQQLQRAGLEVFEIRPILTSQLALREFEKRIQGSYKQGLVKRVFLCRRLHIEDKYSENREGMMLIGRARRPY